MRSEKANDVIDVLRSVFQERGPVDELLLDNSTAFRSEAMRLFCDSWPIRRRYRAAYVPSGNGIVERHHSTIKRMAERCRTSPQSALFWYNLAPKHGGDRRSAPSSGVHSYEWRHPDSAAAEPEAEITEWCVGDDVWVKPPAARCTSTWPRGTVTGVNAPNNVDVDGVPRHVLDIRRLFEPESDDDVEVEPQPQIDRPVNEPPEAQGAPSDGQQADEDHQRPRRQRRRPQWLHDYYVDF